jgi:pyruvate/2-oxoglutarate dehydrogenase complex dihydrolipoamide dehydrogenase (E3) component
MKDHGVKFKMQVTPSKMEKVDGDKIMVTFSDGSADTYDTVLGAIGRYADTDKLGLENVGVKTNPNNKKIPTKFEQTEVRNIYAVGDVMEVCCPSGEFWH